MFCPNCGTKNDDKVAKCAQCGFDQKAKKDAKFKGTVMMKGSPGAAPGTPGSGVAPGVRKASNPALKGTMVGVAPPGLDAIRKQAEAAAAKNPPANKATAPAKGPNPKLKGTMVGLAPPGLNELRKQAEAEAKAKVSKKPNPKLKGTMIGLAPPDMSKEVEAAKAKIAAQKAAASPEAVSPKPAAPKQESVPAKADAAPTSPAKSKIPSKLKGTMMGVAPPDMQAQLAAARAKAAQSASSSPEEDSKQATTPPTDQGPTPVGMPAAENDPPSEPDPLGGTMVGTSPFAPGGAHEGAAPAQGSSPPPSADDFSEDTPAALPSEQEAARRSSLPPPEAHAPVAPTTGTPQAAFKSPISSQAAELPVPTKSSTGPIIFFAVLLILVLGGVAFLIRGGDEGSEEAPTDEAGEPTSPEADTQEDAGE